MINKGDVVALIGDFEPQSIVTLLRLIGLGAIIVPLTKETKNDHDYFFKSAGVDIVIDKGSTKRIRENQKDHKHLNILRGENKPGLVLFSTGTTGKPKAILHDFTIFLKRFENPRPTLKTLNFLFFDHIGGLNTLFHTIYNRGHVVATKDRSVENILTNCTQHKIELLPTTPTFLRLMLLGGFIPDKVPEAVSKFITSWNSSGGKYVTHDSYLSHDLLHLDAYIHITSPIRRLVDLLNIIVLQDKLGFLNLV